MKVSYRWLKEFVDLDLPPLELAERLTMAGAEVEAVTPAAPELKGVVVGKIISCRTDPQRKDWIWCTVSLGKREFTALCGAPNVREGVLVPVARPGSILPGGAPVALKHFGDRVSEGIILSERELGLSQDHTGVMLLDPGCRPGRSLSEELGLNDCVLEIDTTPNRPDLLSIRGVAREVAALLDRPLKRADYRVREEGPAIGSLASVRVLDYSLCPRYCARVILKANLRPSPFWLRWRLMLCGVRPINNVVDATNYVMLELGQPLHAFDFRKLSGGKIIVRPARRGEEIVTIDGSRRPLAPPMLVIADADRPVAVAGVMGGLESEVGDGTADLLLESAFFQAVSVRRTSRSLGLSSEASRRFERGVDPNLSPEALERVSGLIAELTGGKVAKGWVDRKRKEFRKTSVSISASRAGSLIGVKLAPRAIKGILEKLGLELVSRRGDRLRFSIPTFRPDLRRDVDLIEEVARFHGFGLVPETIPCGPAVYHRKDDRQVLLDDTRSLLCGLGLNETITYSFSSEKECDRLGLPAGHPWREMVTILNPVNREQGALRNTLIPGLLQVVSRNQNHLVDRVEIFEAGNVFIPQGDSVPPREELRLGIALFRSGEEDSWCQRTPPLDFFTLKGLMEALLSRLQVSGFSFIPALSPIFQPGQTATVRVGSCEAGLAGALGEGVMANFGLSGPLLVAELSLEVILAGRRREVRYRPLPVYPAVRRDIAVIVGDGVSYRDVSEAIEGLRPKYLESFVLFDVYTGDPIPPREKSLAFRLQYRSPYDTLQEEKVSETHEKFKAALARKLDCRFRE